MIEIACERSLVTIISPIQTFLYGLGDFGRLEAKEKNMKTLKELENLHDSLKSLQYDLVLNNRIDISEKLEAIGRFIQDELDDAITTVDTAMDSIRELQDELNEANDKIDDLERDLSEAV